MRLLFRGAIKDRVMDYEVPLRRWNVLQMWRGNGLFPTDRCHERVHDAAQRVGAQGAAGSCLRTLPLGL